MSRGSRMSLHVLAFGVGIGMAFAVNPLLPF
jgi:hypothetical protein